jgi:iron-sulfur cluster protein
MSDRGGLLAEARRTTRVAPCYAPFKHLVVDWDGSVVVCCQLRSDAPKHANAVVARIGEAGTGLVEAYVALAEWRRSLREFGPKAAPCASCNVSEYSASVGSRLLGTLLAQEALPGLRALKRTVGALIPKAGRP